MIVRPQQHWLRRIFVWHGSVLSKISSRLLLNFLFSIAVIFMLPWYTHLGIKFTLAPFSILGVAIAIFLGFRNNAGYARYVEARKLWGQLMIASRSLLREVKTTLPDSASVKEFVEYTINRLIDNGQQGSIGEIRKLAKYRLKHIDKYYERSGVQFLHGQRPLAFTELKRIALDLKDNLSDEAKFNIELRNAIKLKRNIIMGKGA
ncbi:bestrophin family ion channel [Escherichia marmotae]|jgi:hypothetical protein|uniref:bestrophin family ion channel n=1 Tax=Escherichia marmotae TaxID=1499973 RepID=UPI0028161372|nr:bestrophin family ion channel [Escherichia marmotae]MEC9911760.1 bestrophin family ion channel [Escherichia marmotae]MEC9931849.1 bestrophin family ion channel [Escherichia marmotae]MED8752766.1 bestrophin family ion channel [Escherichia marmotae]MED9341531.1 bestrophin family ion channel [Escherichia marmotae]MED9470699.1 bestrophin family ion channel [Escherichia marmotae]